MPSLSFDPIANIYDATRGYPPGIARMIAKAIATTVKATPETTLMELVTRRVWASTWVVPDDLFAASVKSLERRANDYFGADIDTEYKGYRQFVICKTEV